MLGETYLEIFQKTSEMLGVNKKTALRKKMKEEKAQDKAEKKYVTVEWWIDLSSIATNSKVDTGLND